MPSANMLRSSTIMIPDPELPSGATGLHVVEKGEGDQAILFIHGLGADHYEFIHQVRYFSNRYRCVTFDLRGFGHSPATANMSIDRSVLDVKALAEALGIRKFILMGHSLGTMIGFDFAARFGDMVDKLIIVAGTSSIKESSGTYIGLKLMPTLGRFMNDRQRRLVGGVFAFNIGAFGMRSSPDVMRYYLRENPFMFTNKFFETTATYMDEIAQFDARERIGRIKSPTLVVHGALDPGIYAISSLTSAIKVPGSKLHIFPFCGHSPNIETPGNFNALVEEFIEG
ncbi:MAG: 2-hydroxy-6-oxononadienedioate/2-hydroxy-6-oxononatrienedioate hydrolase [bacterium ADurb.Bin236]|nr:MAG: 2-hydroxy-6-oxononadienedioate/2-hydroxy-6-oxononatrienedioate hydrolase [bacterium ADurb.Bin236]HOY63896.1 alpha/beta hydrolase [bacterium]